VLTFDPGSREACFTFLNKLELIKRATNIYDNKTLIIHPASTIYCSFNSKKLNELDVANTTLRLSVGIEEVGDLKKRYSSCFKRLTMDFSGRTDKRYSRHILLQDVGVEGQFGSAPARAVMAAGGLGAPVAFTWLLPGVGNDRNHRTAMWWIFPTCSDR
jgi:hypothetical protein